MRHNNTIIVAAGVVAAVLTLSSCTTHNQYIDSSSTSSSSSSSATSSANTSAPPTAIIENLEAPWSIAFNGQTALISERNSGRILELTESDTPREVGTISNVEHTSESGLLGIAIRNNYLYTYFTTSQDNRIVRFPLKGQAGAFSLGSAEIILAGIPASAFHNGGRIAFGPDGMLYATVGDASNSQSAQELHSLSGKILRLTPEGDVPEDNPFPASMVYSYGHRNPQGLAWDSSGTLYSSEFGQNTWDELNIITAGGNYGWPEVEGAANREEYIDPVQQWPVSEASPSGMSIIDDTIFIANLRGERLRSISLKDLSHSTSLLTQKFGRLRDVAQAPDGSLWILTNNTDGRGAPQFNDDRVIRLEP